MNRKTSEVLSDVWEAKRIVGEETQHLHGAEYFRYVREQASRVFPGIRHRRVGASAMCVAEERAPYGHKDFS